MILNYLPERPDIELVGLTNTIGNGTINQVYSQTRKLVADLNRQDIPV